METQKYVDFRPENPPLAESYYIFILFDINSFIETVLYFLFTKLVVDIQYLHANIRVYYYIIIKTKFTILIYYMHY